MSGVGEQPRVRYESDAENIIEKKPTLIDSTVQTEYLDELDRTTLKFEIKEKNLNEAVDQANRKAAGLQRDKNHLK